MTATFDPASKWGRFHSSRFELSIGLPNGHEWKIDDHSTSDLLATHPQTASKVELRVFVMRELVNHQRCQEEAESRGFLPLALASTLATVDESDETRGDGFDTHTRVAIEPVKRKNDPLHGHVLAYGAKLHRCFAFHFETLVSDGDEVELSNRMALATTRILRSISFDDGLVETDPTLPRAKR